ncbi:MAG: preprotein translocase subunit SecG [Myxococcaceae bacterium]|jgi:preprotein translocase subunit SecG|nr:MAG: preprotein translocase subunit SecG [Myxococcaceae bacterium]
MVVFFTIVHVLLCVFMIFVILLQPGKDAGMGAALGGGAATSAFGGRGAVTFLSKLTAACAGLFFLTSLGLSFVGVRSSVTSSVTATPAPAAAPAPAAGSTAPKSTDAEPAQAAPKASDAEPAPASSPAPAPPAPTQK